MTTPTRLQLSPLVFFSRCADDCVLRCGVIRYNPANKSKEAAAEAPCVDINGGFTENPIVSRRPDKPAAFQMVFDDLAAELERARRELRYTVHQSTTALVDASSESFCI